MSSISKCQIIFARMILISAFARLERSVSEHYCFLPRADVGDSLLAKTVARTGREGLQDSLSIIFKDGVVIFKPALRDERIRFGEIRGGVIRDLLGDVNNSL